MSTRSQLSRLSTLGLAGAVLALALALVTSTSSSAETVRLRKAINQLDVARHSHAASYDRDSDFGEWISQGGGCDTRAVVLKDESKRPTTQNGYCTIQSGRWFSYYNATTYTTAGSLQIDHTVPAENVWISGAWRWSQSRRVAYYNDLADPRTLVAVDSHDNESKGDSDVTTWLPDHGVCRYVRSWVAVKTRWNLHVTRAEKTRLQELAGSCPNTRLVVVVKRSERHDRHRNALPAG